MVEITLLDCEIAQFSLYFPPSGHLPKRKACRGDCNELREMV